MKKVNWIEYLGKLIGGAVAISSFSLVFWFVYNWQLASLFKNEHISYLQAFFILSIIKLISLITNEKI